MANKVSWEKNGRVAVISFRQATVDPEFIADFCALMDEIENNEEIRVAVIAGAKGKTFFAGYNIGLLAGNQDVSYLIGKTLEVQGMMDRVEQSSLPVIAVVDGYALGGGCELVLAADIVYASERSLFGTPEVKIGLIPAAGGVIRLPRQVGKHKAMEMIMTGKMYSARQACAMGIVNEVFSEDKLWEEALAAANLIADNAPIAVRAGKASVLASINLFDKQFELITAEECSKCLTSQDIKEGAAAFAAKRKPDFKGK